MSAVSKKRLAQVAAKRSGPCVICDSLDGRPERITDARSYTENNVLSFCPACVLHMRRPRSAELDRLREIVHNNEGLYQLIGEDVGWLYENGRLSALPKEDQ